MVHLASQSIKANVIFGGGFWGTHRKDTSWRRRKEREDHRKAQIRAESEESEDDVVKAH